MTTRRRRPLQTSQPRVVPVEADDRFVRGRANTPLPPFQEKVQTNERNPSSPAAATHRNGTSRRLLLRSGSSRRPASTAAARIPVRHPQLRRGRAATGRRRLPCHRALPARARRHPIPRQRRPTHRAAGRARDRTSSNFMDALQIPQAILAGYDWGGRAACVVAALWPERVTAPRVGQRLPHPGHQCLDAADPP